MYFFKILIFLCKVSQIYRTKCVFFYESSEKCRCSPDPSNVDETQQFSKLRKGIQNTCGFHHKKHEQECSFRNPPILLKSPAAAMEWGMHLTEKTVVLLSELHFVLSTLSLFATLPPPLATPLTTYSTTHNHSSHFHRLLLLRLLFPLSSPSSSCGCTPSPYTPSWVHALSPLLGTTQQPTCPSGLP